MDDLEKELLKNQEDEEKEGFAQSVSIKEEQKKEEERAQEEGRQEEEEQRAEAERYNRTLHDNEVHEADRRAAEYRKKEKRNKSDKAKYPHGIRNGNDIITETAQLAYSWGKAAKEDVLMIKKSAEQIHAQSVEKKEARADLEAREAEREARRSVELQGKESPALTRCNEREKALMKKVEAQREHEGGHEREQAAHER